MTALDYFLQEENNRNLDFASRSLSDKDLEMSFITPPQSQSGELGQVSSPAPCTETYSSILKKDPPSISFQELQLAVNNRPKEKHHKTALAPSGLVHQEETVEQERQKVRENMYRKRQQRKIDFAGTISKALEDGSTCDFASSSSELGWEEDEKMELTSGQEQMVGLDDGLKGTVFDTLNADFHVSSPSSSEGGNPMMGMFGAKTGKDESSSEEETTKGSTRESESADDDDDFDSPTLSIAAPLLKPRKTESQEELKDTSAIMNRLDEALLVADNKIYELLVEYLCIPEEEQNIDHVLSKYVGIETDADSPLYSTGKFWYLFVSSVLVYGCRCGLQEIHQKSDNQKISKSPHPLLRHTQRADLWKQFWGCTMPDRGQSLKSLQTNYQSEMPILRIWTFFKNHTSTKNETFQKDMPNQWCYPLLSSMMFSARFRYVLDRVPKVVLTGKDFPVPDEFEDHANYYCALTGVPLTAGEQAYICSFLCEINSQVPVESSGEELRDSQGKASRKKKKNKVTEPAVEMVPTIQTIGCVIRADLPTREIDPISGKHKRVSSEPLIKTIRAISEFDKIIAKWVESWVAKLGSKLPNMKRDTIAYAMTSEEGLKEIASWYISFQVMVATTRHAICEVGTVIQH